jgi:hypothetical protein
MVSRTTAVIFGVMLLAVACGSDDPGAAQDEVGSDVSEPTDTPDDAPVISSGPVATGSVEIDGVVIDYATSVPDGFTVGSEAPVLLAFPPGGQDLGLTRTIVKNTYAPEAKRLGWVVVSPAAPNGELYFQGSEALIPGFLDWVESWVTPEGGIPHVAGISNGGISSFRFAAENPDRVQSIVTFPGFPRSDDDKAALEQLTDVPIRMFVGGIDADWIPPAEETVATFSELGGDIELTIFDREGHVMRSTSDGVLVFEQLEGFR